MTRNKQVRVIFAMIMIVIMMLPSVAMAQTGPSVPPPIGITGPRLKPPAIPSTTVVSPAAGYNNVVAGNVPQAQEANAADGGKLQEAPGRGIKQTSTGYGFGVLLNATPNVCNNFNPQAGFAAFNVKSDIWTDWYAGWGPFAIDNGYYQAKNVVFTMERVVGPGSNFGDNQHSAKIGSHEPYAAGFGSPIIPVPADYQGGTVTVSVKYLIWDHDTGGKKRWPRWRRLGLGVDGCQARRCRRASLLCKWLCPRRMERIGSDRRIGRGC
jgi:hypothetical protein